MQEQKRCCICLDDTREMNENNALYLPCQHRLHESCFKELIEYKDSMGACVHARCPLCRELFVRNSFFLVPSQLFYDDTVCPLVGSYQEEVVLLFDPEKSKKRCYLIKQPVLCEPLKNVKLRMCTLFAQMRSFLCCNS